MLYFDLKFEIVWVIAINDYFLVKVVNLFYNFEKLEIFIKYLDNLIHLNSHFSSFFKIDHK